MYIDEEIFNKYLASSPDSPCFCDSGLLFKECCKIKFEDGTYKPKQIMTEYNKELNRRKSCLISKYYHNCQGVIVRAHSISQQYLKYVSIDGHVLSFSKIDTPKNDNFSFDSLPEPKKIGINDVSVFYGLCSYHDDILFRSFEKKEFVCSKQQIIDLHLRTILKEIYSKDDVFHGINKIKNKRSNNDSNDMIHGAYFATFVSGNQAAKRDLKKELQLVLKWREKQNQIDSLIIEVSGKPVVLNSSFVNPPLNVHGEIIQDYHDKNLFVRSFAFNIIPKENSFLYVFTWIDSLILNKFFNDILLTYNDPVSLLSILIQFSFLFSENSAINPDWWNNLSQIKKERLKKIFWNEIINQIVSDDFFTILRPNMKFVEGEILSIRHNDSVVESIKL